MHFDKIHNKGQARLFKNEFLEKLTKAHPLVIWGMYVPVIIYFLYLSFTKYDFTLGKTTLYFFGGMFFWTFFEYAIHRFLFHIIPNSARTEKIIYTMHGNHHHYPRDKERLFMPPIPSLLIASIIFSITYLILGTNTHMFFPGFMFGYLIYGSMHYAIHAWNPPFKWMKPLWRNHHLHHYKEEHNGFGVSTTLWDRVFGTMYDLSKEKEDKEKTQALMFEKRNN